MIYTSCNLHDYPIALKEMLCPISTSYFMVYLAKCLAERWLPIFERIVQMQNPMRLFESNYTTNLIILKWTIKYSNIISQCTIASICRQIYETRIILICSLQIVHNLHNILRVFRVLSSRSPIIQTGRPSLFRCAFASRVYSPIWHSYLPNLNVRILLDLSNTHYFATHYSCVLCLINEPHKLCTINTFVGIQMTNSRLQNRIEMA